MDFITKQALQKAHLIEGEESSSIIDRMKNTHWIVQILSLLIIVYTFIFKETCDDNKLPVGCLTFWNKIMVIAIVLIFLWLFGKLKTKGVAKKLSRVEAWHVLSYIVKEYLTKIGYVDETCNYNINGLRGVDWVEGEAPVYHYELNIIKPLGVREKYIVRMQSQDTDNSIAGNIVSCELIDYKGTGQESYFRDYLLDRKYAKALKLGLVKHVTQKEFAESGGAIE